ncbi:MAG: (2Fe-2S)-binding protein [Thermoplasmatales archaeon]|nr:(2Fe-2S)-binding protein [Thermoplasmatales archaeon]
MPIVKIVCRCEDVSEEEIVDAIEKYDCETLDELKHLLRIGMGHCQGRTCLIIAARILVSKKGKKIEEIIPSFRPPDEPVEIGILGKHE